MGGIRYLIRRLLLAIPTLIGITLVTFAIISLAPGDPASLATSDALDPEQSARIVMEIRERFHLDEPVHVRYGIWIKDLIQGNLGRSITDDRPVIDKIKAAFWPTLSVNMLGLLLAFLVAVPIGTYAASRQNGFFDRWSGTALYILYSVPSYVGAIILILWVGVKWDLLPFRGMYGDDYDTLSGTGKIMSVVSHMALYVICTAYGSLAYYSRFVRQNMLEVVRQDYVRTARAKGLSENVVVWKHAFRNTLIPFVTLLGLTFPVLISGSVILEVIFTWPGLGRLFFDSILQRDYPVVMALSTATAVLVLVGTLAADMLYGLVDPRVRLD